MPEAKAQLTRKMRVSASLALCFNVSIIFLCLPSIVFQILLPLIPIIIGIVGWDANGVYLGVVLHYDQPITNDKIL